MAGNDTFKALTESLSEAGTKILTDTNTLEAQTNSLLGQIGDTCQLLPSAIYQVLEAGFLSWKSLLGSSDEERNRLGQLLQLTAQAVEQKEQEIQRQFTLKK